MRYRFGEFVLDARSYTLTRSGREVPLQPKVFDVLRYLLEHGDRVVTKEELLDALWKGEHVNEGAVPWSISHARRVLGQERGQKEPIETVHGRGYRFIANVEQLAPSAPPGPLPGASAASQVGSDTPRASLPFVGRGDAMQQLEARLAQATKGEGGLCLLVGEAGIGKTRCAEELSERARQRGIDVWSGRTVEGLGAPVLWPWLQVLREAVRDRPALRATGEALLSKLAALEPAAAPDGESQGTTPHEGGSGRFWVLDGVTRFLLETSAQQQVMVLLDDLHWADAGTVELLNFLAPELRRSSLLVVATLRDELAESERRRMGRLLRAAERIELKRLSMPEVARYIAEVTSGPEPAAELSRAVHRASAGNPLFVQETVRALLAEHAGKELSTIAPSVVKPSQIARDVLRARLRPLDAGALRLLSFAAVLGESFELALLQRLADEPVERLLAALERSVLSGLVVAEGPNRYRFAHDLIRAILYDDMPSSERVAAHRRSAELLTELQGGGPRHSEIAYHYHRSLPAGGYDRVTHAACRAAEAAARVHAFTDAVSFYDWALEAQALDPQVTPRARADLLFAQGIAQRLSGRDDAARKKLALVIDIARQHDFGDLLIGAGRALRPTQMMSAVPDPLVRAALEDVLKIAPAGADPLRISALSQLALVPPYAHDMRRSDALSQQALTLARELGQPSSLLEALRARLYSLSGPDNIDALLETAGELLELGRDTRAWAPIEAHVARFGALVYRGDMRAADAALRDMGRAAAEQRFPETIWFHDRLRAQRRLLDGDFAEAEALGAELRARSKRIGLSYGPAFIDAQRNVLAFLRLGPVVATQGWDIPAVFAASSTLQPSFRASLVRIATDVGQPEAAQRMLDSMALHDFEDVSADIAYLNTLHNLGIAAARLGDRPRAERLYALLAPYPQHNTPNAMLHYDGSVSYSLALLAEALEDDARAEQHFETAVAMNERMGARAQLARVHEAYARFLLGRRGKAGQARAREHVERAVALADALGMTWLKDRVRGL